MSMGTTPRKKRTPRAAAPQTTAQALGSLLKSARDIMRKDKGLNGDLDRLPLLTWIMFLKFLDDLELEREEEAVLAGTPFQPVLEAPYRWRDWAAKEGGITGDELLAFINQDETVLPDGTRGPGLFAYLRGLSSSNGDNRRDVIATVFRGVDNRMKSGYLLRDVVDKVGGIHFTSSEELHTLGALYESMLREMRDAAGDSGEFYTPRAVVRFMVEAVNPHLGETVLDPATGTGGFLVEAYKHLAAQVKTVEDRRVLQTQSVLGCEPKSLPYLLAQMNLLLHGLESPQVDAGNALRFKLTEIGDRDRVDVIVTNPPFGGEEEKGIQGNFPEDKQTAETALLFMQLVMRKLRRTQTPAGRPARAAVVVSDGFLSTKGVASRVKEQLCSEFNLHTVVRLPRGVFTPYTPIATNILFFDREKSTEEVWFYRIPGPTDRQMYSKTKPLKFEELTGCLEWWDDRKTTEHAWRMSINEIALRGYDLDVSHPDAVPDYTSRAPADLLDSLGGALSRLTGSANGLLQAYHQDTCLCVIQAPVRPLSDFLRLRKEFVEINDSETYRLLTVQLRARGIRPRGEKKATDIKTKRQQVVRAGELVVAEIDAKMGGFGLVPPEAAGSIVSSHYFVYELDESIIDPRFFEWWLRSGVPEQEIQPYVKGSTNYAAIRQNHFPMLMMPIPPLDAQRRVVDELEQLTRARMEVRAVLAEALAEVDALVPSILTAAFAPRG